MKPWRVIGGSMVALGLFVGVSSAALAGADTGGPMPVGGKDGGMAPSGMAPSGPAPASVAGAPGRAGGLDPTLLGTLLGSTGLLTLGGGLVLQRKRG